jgi:hypothetical protein
MDSAQSRAKEKESSMNYEAIKTLARESHVPVTELIALAPANDPFYVGTERDKTLGAWFRDLWHAFGYTTGVHIRRMHYAIVSQNPPINFPNGKPYENTEACWNELTNAAKAARYLEYVDPAAFVDRRNDDPVDHLDYWTRREAEAYVSFLDRLEDIALPEPPGVPGYRLDYNAPQRYHLEMWCEKSTMNDILEPLAQTYQATLLFGKGELSITAALQAIKRFQRTGRPVRIFYVSDFDPAGAGMPVSMSRKLEYFVHHLGLDLDIKLYPVVLTSAQTKQYPRLLPTPIKDTERRKATFEAKYGGGAIELDALEALYPGELARVLERELSRYFDRSLPLRVQSAVGDIRARLDQAAHSVWSPYHDEIQAINEEWQAISDALKERLAEHMARRTALWQSIQADLEASQPDVSLEDIPEAREANEREGALYDSTRDYLAQNRVYQAHRANMNNLDVA